MRAVSDYGGLEAGPVDKTEHPPSPRDKRIDALRTVVSRGDAALTSDAHRRAQEELDQDTYDSLAYYDRWLIAFVRLLLQRGYLTREEIEERIRTICAGAGGREPPDSSR